MKLSAAALAAVMLAGTVMVVALPSPAAAEVRTFIDAPELGVNPLTDIQTYTVSLDSATATVSIELGAWDLAVTQSSRLYVELDTDLDGKADFTWLRQTPSPPRSAAAECSTSAALSAPAGRWSTTGPSGAWRCRPR